ncbi:MAG: histidine triad nucleotide-binding protein [Armatimonadetes bacterium]|nr:histidine triad nucleotide-binding protein [Armatimonadota bacterium]
MSCIFCKIASKEVPSDIVYETDTVVAFRDLNPQAPVHILVIPRKHVSGIHEADGGTGLEELMLSAAEVARREEIEDAGYRLVINCGRQGGQTVDHLHVHVLGGRAMSWPPG